jgi:hypothetical protein
MLHQSGITDEDLQVVALTLGRLERFWVRFPELNRAA